VGQLEETTGDNDVFELAVGEIFRVEAVRQHDVSSMELATNLLGSVSPSTVWIEHEENRVNGIQQRSLFF